MRRLLVRVLAPVPALLAMTACRFGAPPGATEQGQSVSRLYQLLFYAAIPVAAIVYGLMIWSLLRYRRRNDRLPRQTRYSVPLEILYTVVPILLVAGLFVETYRTERGVDALSPNPALVVRATAFQWQWRFEYPGSGIDVVGTPGRMPQMVIPAGETVRVELFSADVDHAFYVPQFLLKRDAIPGYPNRFDFRVEQPGLYRGECAEFCGLDHAAMNFRIRALSPDRFDAWLEGHRSSGAA